MKLKISILSLAIIILSMWINYTQSSYGSPLYTTNDEPLDYHIFHMPVEYAQIESHTGIASLAMMFQYYGCMINQTDINDISGTNVDSVRGTPLNGYTDAINYDNYTGRDYGYEVNVSFLTGYSSDERWTLLKEYVENETPVVLGTKYRKIGDYYIHYRILIGYDERTQVLIFNDPYQGYDASTGPYSDFSYSSFSSRWANTDYLVIQINPIKLKLDIPTSPINSDSTFELSCEINSSNLNNTPSELNINLELPPEYFLINGQTSLQLTDIGNSNLVSWTIGSPGLVSLKDEIKVKVTYPYNNYTFGNYVTIRPLESVKPNMSAPNVNSVYSQDYVSPEFSVEGNVSMTVPIPYDVYLVIYDYWWYPDYEFDTIHLGLNQTSLHFTLGPFERNETLVFCWYAMETTFGEIYLSPIKLFRIFIPSTTTSVVTTTTSGTTATTSSTQIQTSEQQTNWPLYFTLFAALALIPIRFRRRR